MTVAQAVGIRLYRQGDSGDVVKAIQLGLAAHGYPLKGTGYFGGATDAAVSAFQRKAGLTVDGVVGPVTAAAIDRKVIDSSGTPAPQSIEVTRPLWLTYGLTLVGTAEVPGTRDNPKIIDWAKLEGGNIAAEYTHDSIPWCALFANHILTKCGHKGTETLWALDFAGKWPAVQLGGPALGSFAPMLRNGGGHIICVAGKDQHGNVMGLGANQSDTTSVIPFPRERLNKGYWWPASVPKPVTGFNTLPIVRSDGTVSSKES